MTYSINEEFHNTREYSAQRSREKSKKYDNEKSEEKRNERRYSQTLQHKMDVQDNFYYPHDTSNHTPNYGYRPAIDRNISAALDTKSSPSQRLTKMNNMSAIDKEAHSRVDKEFSRRDFEDQNNPNRRRGLSSTEGKYAKSIAADALSRKIRSKHESAGIFSSINFI